MKTSPHVEGALALLLGGAILVVGGAARADVATGDAMLTGQTLPSDASLTSKNKRYKLVMQKADSNLVVTDTTTGKNIWSMGVGSGTGWSAIMQADGNLIVYDTGKHAMWSTGTRESKPAPAYFARVEDNGDLNVYRGTPAATQGVLWSSRTGRRYKLVSDIDIAQAFRPHFRFSKRTRCWPLTFGETGTYFTDYCRSGYDANFVVFAKITRPAEGTTSSTDGNNFRVSYGVAFGYQDGSYTGLTQSTVALFTDAGNHGEDAQYLVVDVVDGQVTSVWADLHTGYYARTAGGLTMTGDHVNAWVGAFYHPFKLVSDTSSVCKSAAEGSHGYSANVPNQKLRALCVQCLESRSCGNTDTVLNWGDPGGSDEEGGGKLAMVDDVCGAGDSYTSPDGVTYTSKGSPSLEGMKGYACASLPSGAAGNWKSNFKSKPAYTSAYGLKGCKAGDASAGSICNAAQFPEDVSWTTSTPDHNVFLHPFIVGETNVHFATGTPFSDFNFTKNAPFSITFRAGDRIDAVSITWAGDLQGIHNGKKDTQSHGGGGGSAITLDGLDTDPVTSVRMCSASQDGVERAGYLELHTRSGRVQKGGKGTSNCHTIGPAGKILYGFYGRSGHEVDALGTLWGDPLAPTSTAPGGRQPR